MDKILVLGVGNYLMGDEGIGVHAAKELSELYLPINVEVVDGGTGGFHLLSYLHDYKYVIMIDATMDGKKEGTVRVIEPKFASDFPRSLSAHDIGLRDLIETAVISGELPKIYLIVVSISTIQNMEIELSPPIKSSIQIIKKKTLELINSINE